MLIVFVIMLRLGICLLLVVCTRALNEELEHHEHPEGDETYSFDREVFLGSRAVANQLLTMSIDEGTDKFLSIAQKMDSNGDGMISKEELSTALEQNFLLLDREEATEKLHEWDTNKDGFVDWTEYIYGVYQTDVAKFEELLKGDNKDPAAKATVKTYVSDKFRYSLADKDQDNRLNIEELTAFLHPYDFEHMLPAEIRQTRESYDINEDGVISLDEFIRSDATGSTSEWRQVEEDRFKNELDKNKDGVLDDNELRQWIAPSLSSAASDESLHLISIIDSDGDGLLSQSELSDAYPVLMGAEPFDFEESHDEL